MMIKKVFIFLQFFTVPEKIIQGALLTAENVNKIKPGLSYNTVLSILREHIDINQLQRISINPHRYILFISGQEMDAVSLRRSNTTIISMEFENDIVLYVHTSVYSPGKSFPMKITGYRSGGVYSKKNMSILDVRYLSEPGDHWEQDSSVQNVYNRNKKFIEMELTKQQKNT